MDKPQSESEPSTPEQCADLARAAARAALQCAIQMLLNGVSSAGEAIYLDHKTAYIKWHRAAAVGHALELAERDMRRASVVFYAAHNTSTHNPTSGECIEELMHTCALACFTGARQMLLGESDFDAVDVGNKIVATFEAAERSPRILALAAKIKVLLHCASE